jgi:2'-5' RNA ligase
MFISVPVSEAIRERIRKIQEGFHNFDIKFVEKENLHFCLSFLGEVDENQIDSIKEAIADTAKQFEKFEINIEGLGVFPDKTYIKVLWIGIKDGKNNLCELAEVLHARLEKLGFKEERKFEPHLTLGRVKRGDKLLKDTFVKMENSKIGVMEVNKIELIKSELTLNGPMYETIFKTDLL